MHRKERTGSRHQNMQPPQHQKHALDKITNENHAETLHCHTTIPLKHITEQQGQDEGRKNEKMAHPKEDIPAPCTHKQHMAHRKSK